MADELLNVLRANLANSEAAGLDDKVARLKARIAKIEKGGPAPKVSTATLTDTPAVPNPKPVKKAPAKKAPAKKAPAKKRNK